MRRSGCLLWVLAMAAVACNGDDAPSPSMPTTSTTGEDATNTNATTPSPTEDSATTSGVSMDEGTTGPGPSTLDDTGGSSTSTEDTEGESSYGCQDAVIFANDFDDDAVGPYADLVDWNDPPWESGIEEGRVEIVEGDSAFAGRSLRVHYPEGGVGPGEGGAQWVVDLGDTYDELYLAYRVRFEEGFDFVLGGKLPGLVGGSSPTGCVDDTDGFSARSMWRTEGHGVQYMYFPEKVNSCGDDYDYERGGEPALFEPGTWHTLEHRLVMNTPGAYDGVLQAWVDGELVLDEQRFLFRLSDGTYGIDAVYFSTFFGGSADDWAPTKDEVIDYDDFIVCTGPISH